MRILDVPSYDPEKVKATCVVTLHQFLQYFKDEGGLQNVDAVAAECKICFIIVKVLKEKTKTNAKYIHKTAFEVFGQGRTLLVECYNKWVALHLFFLVKASD